MRRLVPGMLMLAALLASGPADAQRALPDVDARIAAVAPRVVAWRRDIHRNPELGNQEVRTAALVADALRSFGLDEVRAGVGGTGVVGILKGKRPGGVVALRADMDALLIREATGLPFASIATAMVDGKSVPVMHACGHDAHTAMLLGAAQVLAGMRDRVRGTIAFIFQPAEEGVNGVEAGARAMLRDGVFGNPKPDAIFGLHLEPGPVGEISFRPGPMLSSSTDIDIQLKGRQAHAGRPWEGTDLVSLSADIVQALNTLSARRVNVFEFPNVVSIGMLQAGNRRNVLPGEARMEGTIRTFDLARRDRLKALIETTVKALAESQGAQAEVRFRDAALVTRSDPVLLKTIEPALRAAATAGVNPDALLRGAAEDFSFFEEQVPGVYYILGSTANFTTKDAAPPNHSDRFDIDEAVLPVGVKAHVLSAIAFLDSLVR